MLINRNLYMLPIEIKSAHTFNSDFLNNLKFYAKLFKVEKLGNVIFSGETQKRSDFTAFNYFDYFKEYISKR